MTATTCPRSSESVCLHFQTHQNHITLPVLIVKSGPGRPKTLLTSCHQIVKCIRCMSKETHRNEPNSQTRALRLAKAYKKLHPFLRSEHSYADDEYSALRDCLNCRTKTVQIIYLLFTKINSLLVLRRTIGNFGQNI